MALDSLDIHSTDAQITVAAQRGASALRNATDLQHIHDIIENANGNAMATLGPDATNNALAETRVKELYFTHRYLEAHPAAIEDAVRQAVDQKAMVEEVSQEAADALDAHGGVAARLRYSLALAAD